MESSEKLRELLDGSTGIIVTNDWTFIFHQRHALFVLNEDFSLVKTFDKSFFNCKSNWSYWDITISAKMRIDKENKK